MACVTCMYILCYTGIMGSSVADEKSVTDYMPDWLKGNKMGDEVAEHFELCSSRNDCVFSGLLGTAATDKNKSLDVVSPWTEGTRFIVCSNSISIVHVICIQACIILFLCFSTTAGQQLRGHLGPYHVWELQSS